MRSAQLCDDLAFKSRHMTDSSKWCALLCSTWLLFSLTPSHAQLTQSAAPLPPASEANFGQAVAVYGDIAAIGSDFTGPGAVHLYQRDRGGANRWGYLK